MAYKYVYVGEEALPYAISSVVLARAFKEKDLKEIWEAYKNARLSGSRSKMPTEFQKKIADRAKKLGSIAKAGQEFKVAYSVAYAAVNKVAIYKYLMT